MQLLKSGRYLIDHNNQKAWSDYLDQLSKDKTILENNFLLNVSALKNIDKCRQLPLYLYYSHVRLQMYSHIRFRVMTVAFS